MFKGTIIDELFAAVLRVEGQVHSDGGEAENQHEQTYFAAGYEYSADAALAGVA